MKISEKQLQKLLTFCNQVLVEGACLSEYGRKELGSIIFEIYNQQSEELKEFDNEV